MDAAEWGDLSEPERAMWHSFPRGDWVDLRSGDPQQDEVTGGVAWGPERSVRAEVVAALLLGAAEVVPGCVPALRLRGVRITGRLDLMGAEVDRALVCEHCRFDGAIRLVEATVRTVRLVDSLLPGLNAARMRCAGILDLRGSRVDAGIRLDRAKVVGEIRLRGASIGADPDGVTVAARGLAVDGDLDCGVTTDGSLLFDGAKIDGSLDLSGARVDCAGRDAVVADRAVINGALRANGLVVNGAVRMLDARIAGSLHISDARLHNPGGTALGASRLTVQGGVWARGSFTADGEVRLVDAELRANLSLNNAVLRNPGGNALNLDRATIMDLDGADLTVTGGTVSLVGTRIANRLNLERADLDCAGDPLALIIEGADVTGGIRLNDLRVHGETRIRTCRVGGSVLLVRTLLSNPGGVALRFTRNEVAADLYGEDFETAGELRLIDSRIGRSVILRPVRLHNPGGVAVDASGLQAIELEILPGEPIQGAVNLRHARLRLLRDDPARWPERLHLDGLTYQVLEPQLPANKRLEWLTADPDGYSPQPYEQLAALYTGVGQPAEARRVLYAKEQRQRATVTPLRRAWSYLQDMTVGYGYQPWRAAVWLVLLLAVGSVVYGIDRPHPIQAGAPSFNPVIYTLDLLLPIVDLGQKHTRNPTGAEQWLSYLLIAAGWLLVSTIAAGIARILSRR
jgi:cytoskeletal protein CcmA (bactofilin family)